MKRIGLMVVLLAVGGCGVLAGPQVSCEILPDVVEHSLYRTLECTTKKDVDTFRVHALWNEPGSVLNPHGEHISAHDASAGEVIRIEDVRLGATVTVETEGPDSSRTFTVE